MDGTVKLEGMEFRSNHGCLESEKRDGNIFLVDFEGTYDISRAAATDNLCDAVDYGAVYCAISQEMAIHSDLLEHLAGRIAERIMRDFNAFKCISIVVAKKNPPVGGAVAWSKVSVTLLRQ